MLQPVYVHAGVVGTVKYNYCCLPCLGWTIYEIQVKLLLLGQQSSIDHPARTLIAQVAYSLTWYGGSHTTVNTHLLLAADQHGFRRGHSTTSALLQLTSDVETGFNQRKPPHRTICVVVDLTGEFDTVSHNALLSKVSKSSLPQTTCRWLSNCIRGRQSIISCRGINSKARIINPCWRSVRLEVGHLRYSVST